VAVVAGEFALPLCDDSRCSEKPRGCEGDVECDEFPPSSARAVVLIS